MADQGAEGLLSPWLRKHRIAAAKPYLKGRVLDVGCGSGALAGLINAENYVGVDIDEASLELSRSSCPRHEFRHELPDKDERFDTIVSLAVIEHVKDPAGFLRQLATYLKPSSLSSVVITTPHPSMDFIHDLGSAVGIFSRHANEEHEVLLDQGMLRSAGQEAGLAMVRYRRFLLGANSLAEYKISKR